MRESDLPPCEGPSVFSAADVDLSTVTVDLDAADVAELTTAAARVCARGDGALRELEVLTAARFPLPRLAGRLARLRERVVHGEGFALLRGLPVDGPECSPLRVATMFMGIGAHVGAARPQNAAGHLLGHVCDLGLSSADPNVRIYQTRERQTFHTDSCDVVGLLCLREAEQGGDSLFVSAGAIYNEMRATRPDLLARLLRPMAHDRRGEASEDGRPFYLLPVFTWFREQLTVFYQRQYIESAQRFPDAPRLAPRDLEALDLFDALANDPAFHVTMRLAPGDVQLLHNHALLHDRTAFVDSADPSKRRHLLRLWLAAPGARPLPETFAARYGSVTVGDRGGVAAPGARPHVVLAP